LRLTNPASGCRPFVARLMASLVLRDADVISLNSNTRDAS
jgi:hypothetical protein